MTAMKTIIERLGADVAYDVCDVDLAPHLSDYAVSAAPGTEVLGVVRPRTTAQVSQLLAIASESGVCVVPQGGMSGLAGGAVPVRPSIIVAMDRMNTIEQVDASSMTMRVQAGAVLETVQHAAKEAGLFFPVDIGGRGSAQIGGMIATNAGGNRVLRYGMMRDQVLGLEVVLPDGTVLPMLNAMLKNNSGYDLKHLFVGAEGTLGIVTRAVLRLAPSPTGSTTALCALKDYDATLALLALARRKLGPQLSSFEIMWPDFYALGTDALGRTAPIAPVHGIYALVEALWTAPDADDSALVELIGDALESGVVDDGVVASSVSQSDALWAIRESTSEFSRTLGRSLGFDISIPTAKIAQFADEHRRRISGRWPTVPTAYFGHIADGNLHIALSVEDNPLEADAMELATYELVGEWGGAVSAEHGIGSHKIAFLHHSRTPGEIRTMRLLKHALDPSNIMNPGKVFDF